LEAPRDFAFFADLVAWTTFAATLASEAVTPNDFRIALADAFVALILPVRRVP
jgi:hypothetical protein